MSDRKKSALNLGDIIRKLNDGNAPESGAAPALRDQNRSDISAGKTASQIQSELPPQPKFGIKTQPEPIAPLPPVYRNEPVPPPVAQVYMPPPAPPLHQTQTQPQHAVAAPVHHPSPSVLPALANKGNQDDDDDEPFDLAPYIAIVIRRWKMVVFALLIAIIYSIFHFVSAQHFYIAHARLLFKPETEQVLDDRNFDIYADREKNFNTHLELLKSRAVLSIVSAKLDSEPSAVEIYSALTITPGMTGTDHNDIIELSYQNANPEKARDVLNELCRSYIDYRHDINSQEDSRLLVKLNDQIDKVQSDLTNKEDALREFKEQNHLVELSSEASEISSKAAQVEASLHETEMSSSESSDRFNAIQSQIGKQDVDVISSISFSNPLQTKLSELEMELSTLSVQYGPNHYKVKNVTAQIDSLKRALGTELSKDAATGKMLIKNPIRENLRQQMVSEKVSLVALQARKNAEAAYLSQLDSAMNRLPATQQQYAYLERETQSLLATLEMLKTKCEEVKVRRDSKETDIKILEFAEVPRSSVSGVKVNDLFVYLLAGLLVGILLCFLIEYLDQSIKDPRYIEKQLGIPVVGLVPQIDDDSVLIDVHNLSHAVLEPLRKLRMSIKHLAEQRGARVIALCSPVKGEGKTTLATNVAITFALEKIRIVIVDCDLRRSQLHHVFQIPRERGLSDYLLGNISVTDSMKSGGIGNLQVVTAGTKLDNPAELISSPAFAKFIAELRPHADIIICDSPAIIPVSDTLHIARFMDMCLLVARAHWTPSKALAQTVNQLSIIGVKPAGCIVNGLAQTRGYYPYYYGNYGYYQYNYDYDKEPEGVFSIREIGLAFDEKIRTMVRTVSANLPSIAALIRTLVFSRTLASPSFWLVLIALVGTTMARKHFEALEKLAGPKEIITYVGGAPNSAVTLRQPDATSDSGMATTPFGLDDSVSELVDATNRRDTTSIFRFYDRESFSYPGGNLDMLKRDILEDFTQDTLCETGTVIKTAAFSRGDSSYIETRTDIRFKMGERVEKSESRVSRVWHLNNGSWRIIREKESSLN